MSDSYVCSGAMMRCTMGTSPATLTVLPVRTVFLTGQPQANISDHKSMVNLAPFGLCRSLGFPATASATAAALGTLTPMPCMHNTPAPWIGGKMDCLIKGQPALLKSSKCQCMWGGTISLVTDGQVGEGTQYVQKKQQEDFELQQEDNSGLNQDSVLDGIQLALDVAGFTPGVGAIPDLINASISALRGNWVDAGMSLLAAVPGIGDAAAAAKIARKGVKAAKAAQKGGASAMKGTSEIEELRRIRAKKLGTEYDPKNSEILYDSIDPSSSTTTNQSFGSLTASTHKVKPVEEIKPVGGNGSVAKGMEKSQTDIMKENNMGSNPKTPTGPKEESPLKYQGGKGKDPSRQGENIDYNA